MLNINDDAPDFTLFYDIDKKVSLLDLKGKKVVIYFYPKDDTPGCTIEAKDFSDLSENFARNNTVVIGISRDSLDCHNAFKKKYSLNLILASDKDSEVCKLYGVLGQKSMFGKKYMGILRTSFLVNELGKITKIWQKVKVNNHAREVLEAVELS